MAGGTRRGGRRPAAGPQLDGAIAVVTGAGSGIGRATALRLAELGATVHVVDVAGAAAADTRAAVEAQGGRAVDHAVDVSDAAAVDALADRVFTAGGRVDVLVNNAGIACSGPIEAMTTEDWQRVVGVNLLGVGYGVQAFVPRMLERRRPATVVNVASIAGLVPSSGRTAYCASKYGVVGLTRALHAELAPQGIRVAAVCPGLVRTGLARNAILRGAAERDRPALEQFIAQRGTPPEAVAEVITDAIHGRWLVRVVPRRQTALWLAERASPRAAQALKDGVARLIASRA